MEEVYGGVDPENFQKGAKRGSPGTEVPSTVQGNAPVGRQATKICGVRIRIRFSVLLVSSYAHVFILLSVVIVPYPA